jgi:peptide/nickel transport system permease protein
LKIPYLRTSFTKQGKKVNEIISDTLPNTIVLASTSMMIAILIGLSFGILSALNKDSYLDNFVQFVSTIGMSVPSFFSAIIFAWLFGYVLKDYTGLNMTGNIYELDDYGEKYILKFKNLLLPSIVLGIRPLAVISQLMRNELLEVLSKDYIRTARSKGISEFKIILNHSIKNSLNPVITAISGWFASMLAGAVFVEYIFGWNGLGKEIVNALNNLDLPVIMGSVIVIASMFIVINVLVDYIYKLLDPRVKLN